MTPEAKQRRKKQKSHYNRIRYAENRELFLARRKEYYRNNRNKCCEDERQRRLNNQLNNPVQYRECRRAQYLRRREKHAEGRERWKQANLEKVKAWDRQYRIDNRDKLRRYISEYKKKRTSSDVNYRLRIRLASRISAVLRGTKKSQPTLELIGCNLDTLKLYLERHFTIGMSWNNYGAKGWHIDHIIPCSSFDLTDPEQQKKCFHYKNLQPLWWWENFAKGRKLAA